ncbi:hypothetical protein CSAL01_13525 [Colletotrichum salicis]|uniref:Uncharacterized protein n=1 Tax=Colletotrichum salicis TaxID=1209931 RepID=A0A135V3L7_9PEZI|nr:hypothetical protein CSAL01_13525 [Colletotrichum salicis]
MEAIYPLQNLHCQLLLNNNISIQDITRSVCAYLLFTLPTTSNVVLAHNADDQCKDLFKSNLFESLASSLHLHEKGSEFSIILDTRREPYGAAVTTNHMPTELMIGVLPQRDRLGATYPAGLRYPDPEDAFNLERDAQVSISSERLQSQIRPRLEPLTVTMRVSDERDDVIHRTRQNAIRHPLQHYVDIGPNGVSRGPREKTSRTNTIQCGNIQHIHCRKALVAGPVQGLQKVSAIDVQEDEPAFVDLLLAKGTFRRLEINDAIT